MVSWTLVLALDNTTLSPNTACSSSWWRWKWLVGDDCFGMGVQCACNLNLSVSRPCMSLLTQTCSSTHLVVRAFINQKNIPTQCFIISSQSSLSFHCFQSHPVYAFFCNRRPGVKGQGLHAGGDSHTPNEPEMFLLWSFVSQWCLCCLDFVNWTVSILNILFPPINMIWSIMSWQLMIVCKVCRRYLPAKLFWYLTA